MNNVLKPVAGEQQPLHRTAPEGFVRAWEKKHLPEETCLDELYAETHSLEGEVEKLHRKLDTQYYSTVVFLVLAVVCFLIIAPRFSYQFGLGVEVMSVFGIAGIIRWTWLTSRRLSILPNRVKEISIMTNKFEQFVNDMQSSEEIECSGLDKDAMIARLRLAAKNLARSEEVVRSSRADIRIDTHNLSLICKEDIARRYKYESLLALARSLPEYYGEINERDLFKD